MDLTYGIAGVLIGGILNGSFVAPMKKMPAWKWENSWLVYSVSGLFVIPWIAALSTVPDLGGVLGGASQASIWRVLLFGLGWGLGSVLFGLGVARMGLAVGYGLILGLIAPIGTFLPLVVLHPEQLQTRRGISLVVGTLIVVGGIALCAKAGKMREKGSTLPVKGFAAGLLICVLAGIFSPMLNFSFAFGTELQERALEAGASRDAASNAIWPLCLTAGLVANAGYAALLLGRNRTWGLFRGAASHWFWGILMGLLCFGSFIVYGAGANALGPLGAVVGWPLFMSMSLITSNTLGWMSGEWRGAPPKAIRLAVSAIAVLIVAITVIAVGGKE